MGKSLRDGDEVIGMDIVAEDDSLLTSCENGYGKRTPVENYRMQKRGGKGVINIKASARNGMVVSVKKVDVEDEIMLITKQGIINRQKVKEIRAIGRNTQGVRLLNLHEQAEISAIRSVMASDEKEDEPQEMKSA